jgi:predicted ester cyclase
VATETGTDSSTEQVARAYFACVTARDPDGMMELWRPGGTGTIHGITELQAPDSYRAWFAKLFAAIPDMRFEVIDVIAEDDRAAVRWRSEGTFNGTGDFEGVEPTGAKVELEGCDLLKIEDGKLVSLEAYMNGNEFARQVGLLPPLGSGPDKALLKAFNLKTRAVSALRRRRQNQA